MRYAIVESGGKQYKAVEGQSIAVDRLPQEVGKKVTLEDVLLVSNEGEVTIGAPTISGVNVQATVVEQFKGPKVIIFKYHPRKRYRLKRGHRQWYTRLQIESIVGIKTIEPKAVEKKEEAPKAKAAPSPKKEKAVSKKDKSKAAAKPAKKQTKPKEKPAKKAPSTNRKLTTVGLDKRSTDALEEAGITTVSQFLKKLAEGDDAILEVKGFGAKGLENAKKILKKAGYKLP
jgi:large subunit ribosomal protein L21